MASAIEGVQRMPERSILSLMRFLQAPSNWPAGNGETESQIFVVTHVGGIVLEVRSHLQQSFLLASNQPALGDGLAKALDDLRHIAFKDAKRHEFRMNLSFGAPPRAETHERALQMRSRT